MRKTILLALAIAAALGWPAAASARGYGQIPAAAHWRARPIAHAIRPAALRRYAVARSPGWRAQGRHGAVSRLAAARPVGRRAGFVALAAAPALPGGGTVGRASFYSGGRTASGGLVGAATCAHRSLPFGTRVLVTNLANLRRMVLTVNDRGPFVGGRMMDVSRTAAAALGMLQSGVANIRMQVIGGPG